MAPQTTGVDLTSALMSALSDDSFTTPAWQPNPRAVIGYILGTKGIGFTIDAPVRGEDLRKTVVSLKSAPELHRFFSGLLIHGDAKRSGPTEPAVEALQRAGVLLPPQKVPEQVQFTAPLEDQDILTAGREMSLLRPDDARTSTRAPFESTVALAGRHLVWLQDSARHVAWPFWLTREQLLVFDGMTQEARPLDRTATWNSQLADARDQIARLRYAVVRDLIPVPFLRGIQSYYRRLVTNGYLRLGDGQSLRYSMHNEPLARWLHHHTESFVTRALPEPAKCSYCYIGFYVAGAELAPHTDREQCEYTLSLTIDATPNAAREDAWPLYVDLPDGSRVDALLAPGDGLIFKGRELPHYRHKLPEGRTSSSIFFHYVPADFTGRLD